MSFSMHFKQELLRYNLLNHPFYQMWSDGNVKIQTLRNYATHYFAQVSNFPTYISATHSITKNLESRKILTENLVDEELQEKDHASLWKDFCFALGLTEIEITGATLHDSIHTVVETCKLYASKSSASGFGVLYAQEHNYANIAKTKKEGLQKHFGIFKNGNEENFFTIHEKADIWHAKQVELLLDTLSPTEQEEAKEAGIAVMKALNGFLDYILTLENNGRH